MRCGLGRHTRSRTATGNSSRDQFRRSIHKSVHCYAVTLSVLVQHHVRPYRALKFGERFAIVRDIQTSPAFNLPKKWQSVQGTTHPNWGTDLLQHSRALHTRSNSNRVVLLLRCYQDNMHPPNPTRLVLASNTVASCLSNGSPVNNMSGSLVVCGSNSSRITNKIYQVHEAETISRG